MENKTVAEMLREGVKQRQHCDVDIIGNALGRVVICDAERPCFECEAEWFNALADMIEAEEAKVAADAAREVMHKHDGVDVAALLKLADHFDYAFGATDWAKTIRNAVKGAKPQLPEGIEWPRYEDGELVKFGDEYVNALGNTAPVERIMFTANGYKVNRGQRRNFMQEYGTPVKRPEPEVLDADGVPIKVGDTVWYATGCLFGEKRIVARIEKADAEVRVFFTNGCFGEPEELTHRKPDTQEAIDADAAKEPCVYFNGTYLDKCDKCKLHDNDVDFDFDVQFNECRTAMNRDLLTRQRKLMGGE